MSGRLQRIARAFGRAEDYDRHAAVQQEVARWLAGRIAATGPHRRVLEIGCGTGLLAAAAAGPSGADDWLLTDLAPAMLARSRERLGGRAPFRTAVLDGERPALPGEAPFDLVCSSLAAQWFGDLAAAVSRQLALVRPGGRVLLTTLAAGTFAEWQDAVAAAGGVAGTPPYPDDAALDGLAPEDADVAVDRRRFTSRPGGALELLGSVKRLGAGTPRAGHRPLAPGALREAARRFDAAGGVLGYEVALIDIRLRERA